MAMLLALEDTLCVATLTRSNFCSPHTCHRRFTSASKHLKLFLVKQVDLIPFAHPPPAPSFLPPRLTSIRDTAVEPGSPVGVLTLDNRDRWTHAHVVLLAVPGNAKKARLIKSAIIVLCLDETFPITREGISWSSSSSEGRNRSSTHQHACLVSLLHLSIAPLPPVIVNENGRCAFCGEHACMDGTPTLRKDEYILARGCHSKRRSEATELSVSRPGASSGSEATVHGERDNGTSFQQHGRKVS
ncbi:hypothetical protein C0992_004806 [Termitomyces sp. T32_za158]|nr:hypothetical protein C0992_004806 [Termitomyces sp. T32_za158]